MLLHQKQYNLKIIWKIEDNNQRAKVILFKKKEDNRINTKPKIQKPSQGKLKHRWRKPEHQHIKMTNSMIKI